MTGAETFYERHLQAFGENIARDAAELSADVLPVRHGGGKRHQLAVVENRQREDQVIQMAAHRVTVVGQQNVAGLDVFLAPKRDLRLDRIGQAADEHRQPQTDRDRITVGVEKTDGEILGLVDNRMIRRAHQVGLHLAGDRHHRAANHLSGKGINFFLAALGIANFRSHISQLFP